MSWTFNEILMAVHSQVGQIMMVRSHFAMDIYSWNAQEGYPKSKTRGRKLRQNITPRNAWGSQLGQDIPCLKSEQNWEKSIRGTLGLILTDRIAENLLLFLTWWNFTQVTLWHHNWELREILPWHIGLSQQLGLLPWEGSGGRQCCRTERDKTKERAGRIPQAPKSRQLGDKTWIKHSHYTCTKLIQYKYTSVININVKFLNITLANRIY